MKEQNTYSGNIVDIVNKKIFKGTIEISNNKIANIVENENVPDNYILPGFIDAHVHIESSMLTPSKFAEVAIAHGIIATVSDPHEIANVMGKEGIDFMLEDAKKATLKFFFGAPSCVPATSFETSGFAITTEDINELLKKDEIKYLSEMMNYPGVIFQDKEVIAKLKLAQKYNKPVDGHAPGLIGDDLEKYVSQGISTDHECTTIEEAIEKIKLGMKILIREGSAAKNFEILSDLIDRYPDEVMLCTDDTHPDELLKGTIPNLVKRAIRKGYDIFNVLRAASLNAVKHYNLPVGLLQKGDIADFIIVENLIDFKTLDVIINGKNVPRGTSSSISDSKNIEINNFGRSEIDEEMLELSSKSEEIFAIETINKELLTKKIRCKPLVKNNNIISDIQNDFLKITVLSRYDNSNPTVGIIKNFGLKKGAVATSIAHDSHNIVAVGASDRELTVAINSLIKNKGGIIVYDGNEIYELKLPIAGLMTNEDANSVAQKHAIIDAKIKELGSELTAPLMTLSFMALLVIPEFKIGDKGLFDGNKFELSSIYCEK